MSIDKATAARIGHLARIRLSEEEQERLSGELSAILGWVEQLGQVDTDTVEPLANVAAIELFQREDAVIDGNCPDAVLANAPEEAGGFFVVPKIVE